MKLRMTIDIEADDSLFDESGNWKNSAELTDQDRMVSANGSDRARALLGNAPDPIPAANRIDTLFLGYFPVTDRIKSKLKITDRKVKVIG